MTGYNKPDKVAGTVGPSPACGPGAELDGLTITFKAAAAGTPTSRLSLSDYTRADAPPALTARPPASLDQLLLER